MGRYYRRPTRRKSVMRIKKSAVMSASLMALAVAWIMTTSVSVTAGKTGGRGQGGGQGQRGQGGAPGGPGGGRGGAAAPLPQTPTAVALPTVSIEMTGPGSMYESVQSLAPDKTLWDLKYEAKEYIISGTA